MSLRGRLLIALMALMLCGLVVADAATYVALRGFLVDQVDQRLAEVAASTEHAIDERHGRPPGPPGGAVSPRGGGGVAGDPDDVRIDANRIGTTAAFLQLRDSDGDVTYTLTGSRFGTDQADPALPAVLTANRNAATSFTTGSTAADGPAFRVLVTSMTAGGGTIVAALPLDDVQLTLNRLLAIEAVVTLAIVVASVGVGLWVVRVGLRPLDDISVTAAEIAAGDLTKRVERADDKTEVGKLGSSLNEMLGQIETAFDERQRSEEALRASEERLRRFVADASHELRTPLAAVQAYAELFERAGSEHPEDVPRMMENIRNESARMAVLVDDLLLLTRLDQRRPLEQEPVDLGAIAADAVESARAVDPDRVVSLHVDGSVEVRGDRVRLRQIVDNLLANVRVHTPPETAVEVAVEHQETFGIVRVADHGPGLDEEQQRKVFERFYRADPARSRSDGGSGLGLSIVSAIAAAHGGAARVLTTPGGGATFEVAVPLLDG